MYAPTLRMLCIPIQIAFRVKPRHRVPLWLAQGFQFLIIVHHVWLPIVNNGGKLAIVLQFVFELRHLGNYPFALLGSLLILQAVGGAVNVVDALREDDRPSFACRRMGERGWIACVVLC